MLGYLEGERKEQHDRVEGLVGCQAEPGHNHQPYRHILTKFRVNSKSFFKWAIPSLIFVYFGLFPTVESIQI